MARAVFLYDSFSDGAAVSGGSFVSTLPLSNVQTRDLREVARTTSVDSSATQFRVDFGKLRPIGGYAIGPTNISPGATYRIRLYGGPDGTEQKYDSGPQIRPGSGIEFGTLVWGHPALWTGIDKDEVDTSDIAFFDFFQTDILASSMTVEIIDEGNARGYIDIGRLLIGRALRFKHNYAYGSNSFFMRPLTDREESLAGTEFFFRRAQRRGFRCVFEYLPETQLFDAVYRVMELGVEGQMFVIPDIEDTANLQKRSFFSTLNELPAIEQAVYRRGTTAFDLKEVL